MFSLAGTWIGMRQNFNFHSGSQSVIKGHVISLSFIVTIISDTNVQSVLARQIISICNDLI